MNKRVLVCDLDNTLYDWVTYFVTAFYAMVDEVVRLTNCDRERLLDDFKAVHRKYHDSEHPFSLLETQTIRELFPNQTRAEIARKLDSAFHAFNSSRRENLRLYPSVREGLEILSKERIILLAHTESNLYAVVDRLTRLQLTKYFSRIYCRERPSSEHPNPHSANRPLKEFPMDRVVELSHHQRKPNPAVLLEICDREGFAPHECAYVGDSMTRDILMAHTAKIFAIWAEYGAAHRAEFYQRLVRVTHWTESDVIRERESNQRVRGIQPDYVLKKEFIEILGVLLPVGGRSIAVG